MQTRYKIHPSIGVARLGNSEHFYIGPETLSGLPIQCDDQGNPILGPGGQEQPVTGFRDAEQKILRQAARFRVVMYDDAHPDGIELAPQNGTTPGTIVSGSEGSGELIAIQWVVWMGNKKASWYQFKELNGEHGYLKKDSRLRNKSVSNRQALVIDPGPVFVATQNPNNPSSVTTATSAEMALGQNPMWTQSFPPPLQPASISSLGSVRLDDDSRLLVVGAYGNSGSMLTGLGQPEITHFANNDGWFDDIADGPVTAVLWYLPTPDQSTTPPVANPVPLQITDPAWCVVGYPRFAPQIPDMITLDDLLYDLNVREFAYAPFLYGAPPFGPIDFDPEDLGTSQTADAALAKWRRLPKQYNENYWPYWDTDLYPILSRPYLYQSFTTLTIQDDPHETGANGNFDMTKISVPPAHPNDPANDPYWGMRNFIYSVLRQPGQENRYALTVPQPPPMQPLKMPLMPLLNGDNPLTNEIVSKFLTLTPTQLFFLKQWAAGKFIGGVMPTDQPNTPVVGPPPQPWGARLDRAVIGNALGGAFCPGAEVTWIIRNPDIYVKPYRIRQAPWQIDIGDTRQLNLGFYDDPELNAGTKEDFSVGLQAGDLTKRNAVPWQADFNQCTTNDTNVQYENWNKTRKPFATVTGIIWWPAHHPLQVNTNPTPGGQVWAQWAYGISETDAGNVKMVTAWKTLGFLINDSPQPVSQPWFYQIDTDYPKT